MPDMTMSKNGRAFLERHEGVVLRAYRDAAGVLTIGAGLTAASGVVIPKPGMTITKDEASRLLSAALQRNYEPTVRRMLSRYGEPDYAQAEFDGAVSFHFNTGAIARASWVEAWHQDDREGVRRGLLKWVKGGGKVLPGLKRRREEEARLILDGTYNPTQPLPKVRPGVARITLRLADVELAATRDGLRRLGYNPGPDDRFILSTALERFQRDHDLTVDGILGRATLSTLQRRLDMRRKSGQTAITSTGGVATTQIPGVNEVLPDAAILMGAAILTALAIIILAWRYRDIVAVKVQLIAPKLATWLRSR